MRGLVSSTVPENPVRTYLTAIRRIHRTGEAVAETSYYGALETLLNAIGDDLIPSIHCVVNPRNRGSGIADLGLFTQSQIRDAGYHSRDAWQVQLPDRGVIEAKPPSWELSDIARLEQVSRYLNRYGQVLITNFREFQLIRQVDNSRSLGEPTRLAATEAELWRASIAEDRIDEVYDQLKAAIMSDAPLNSPEALASVLALYARMALRQVKGRRDRDLDRIKSALEKTLGLTFEGQEAAHFFESALVQTLFYGIFSVWIMWVRSDPLATQTFEWRTTGWGLKLPMIGSLFDLVATPQTIRLLRLKSLLDQAGAALHRVNRVPFFLRFDPEHAIEYFYEPFLEAYDPELRKELGVWYTPPEVVKYMVERVDRIMRVDFGLPDGLADDSVYVLDPCVGTGSFLIEILKHIAATLNATRSDDMIAADLKRAAVTRLFGFEVLPAPFVIAHLQMSILLQEFASPLASDAEPPERLPIYLTNALTGWDDDSASPEIPFEAFRVERDAANQVKRDSRILVVIGNPPYNAFAGVSPPDEANMLAPYKEGIRTRNSLDDLYVRFFRVGERQISELSGRGVLTFISNRSYLSSPSFRSMRQHLAANFDTIHIDDTNGDRDETGKITPDGSPDPSIFSTKRNKAGIAEGTAIAALVRLGHSQTYTDECVAKIAYRTFWGKSKREDLLRSLDNRSPIDPSSSRNAVQFEPDPRQYYTFRPLAAATDFYRWPSLHTLCKIAPVYGLHEARGGVLIDTDKNELVTRVKTYLDPAISFSAVDERFRHAWYGFVPSRTRSALQRASRRSTTQISAAIEPFTYRPFDQRYAYWQSDENLWVAPQPLLVKARRKGAKFLYARRTVESSNDGAPLLWSSAVGDQHALHKTAYLVPTLYVEEPPNYGSLFGEDGGPNTLENLSDFAKAYLTSIGYSHHDGDFYRSEALFLHVLAISSAPEYIRENRGALRQRFPHIPLPKSRAGFDESVQVGRVLADLHDGGSGGATRSLLVAMGRTIAVIRSRSHRPLQTGGGDFKITAGWGRLNENGAVMPGHGSTTRQDFSDAEEALLRSIASWAQCSEASLQAIIAQGAQHIHLNPGTFFASVPTAAWEYKIGGFLVLKKWLSYRDYSVSNRSLDTTEARLFQNMVIRLTIIALLGDRLDANYRAAKDDASIFDELLDVQAEDVTDT